MICPTLWNGSQDLSLLSFRPEYRLHLNQLLSLPSTIHNMEDPNLIAILIPTDEKELAKSAFRLPYNRARYLPPRKRSAAPVFFTREITPAPPSPKDDYNSCHRIELSLKKRPKRMQYGYVFGADPQPCDVVLEGIGVSGQHFCITFDEEQRIILKDFSTYGTAVSIRGQAKNEVRHGIDWILSLDDGKYDIVVQICGLEFKIKLASHETCEDEFLKNVNIFLEESRSALPALDVLGIYSHKTTAPPSQPLSPRQRPIYLKDKELGSGAFGNVYRVIDVSTGSTHASKEFKRCYRNIKNKKKRAEQKLKWQKGIRNEVHIMMSYPHVSMVLFG